MNNRSKYGWLELAVGVLLIILGIYTFANPGTTLAGIVVVYGVMAILTGIADIVFYVRLERRTGFGPTISLVAGILSILAGFFIATNPHAGTWVLAILFPLWFMAHCISRLANLGVTRLVAGDSYYYVSLVVNVIGLVLGMMLLFLPGASTTILGVIVGIYLLLSGVASVMLALSKLGAKGR